MEEQQQKQPPLGGPTDCSACCVWGAAYRFSANKSKIPPGNSAIFETSVPVANNRYSQISPLRGHTCIVVPVPSIPSYIVLCLVYPYIKCVFTHTDFICSRVFTIHIYGHMTSDMCVFINVVVIPKHYIFNHLTIKNRSVGIRNY